MPGRTIAVGDIHGCSIALAALIDAIGPQPDDTLVTLGDYVNKGLDSKCVFDFLLELESRCNLVPLLGNHDDVSEVLISQLVSQTPELLGTRNNRPGIGQRLPSDGEESPF